MKPFVSGPIKIADADIGKGYGRADLVLDGVEHSGASYELRVFFNNPAATVATGTTPETGYAGSFYIFGHGGCFGDEGHCDVPVGPRRPFDGRPAHQLTPAKMWITVTDALRTVAAVGHDLVITIVPVFRTDPGPDQSLTFDRVSLLTYR